MKVSGKLLYLSIAIATIPVGLLVRMKAEWFTDLVNLMAGDALYAFMMYYIVSFLFAGKSIKSRFVISLAICWLIEFSQLYQAGWINDVRATLPGRLVLGSGFLMSDLLAYFLGVIAAFFTDILLRRKLNCNS